MPTFFALKVKPFRQKSDDILERRLAREMRFYNYQLVSEWIVILLTNLFASPFIFFFIYLFKSIHLFSSVQTKGMILFRCIVRDLSRNGEKASTSTGYFVILIAFYLFVCFHTHTAGRNKCKHPLNVAWKTDSCRFVSNPLVRLARKTTLFFPTMFYSYMLSVDV